MKRKVWIMSSRFGEEMFDPILFQTREEAESAANDYIREAILWDYNNAHPFQEGIPTKEDLEYWADRHGYKFMDYYYKNDHDDAVEAFVTGHEIDV